MSQAEAAVPEAQTRGKVWVRSFLFSVKIDSPLARLHILSKLYAILLLSLIIVRFIDTERPDPVGAIFMILWPSGALFEWCAALAFPFLPGRHVPRTVWHGLCWIVFNPVLRGHSS